MIQNECVNESSDYENNNFPGFTIWHHDKYCCIRNAIYIKKLPNKVFLGHWEVQPEFPIFVTILIVTSYFFGMIIILPTWKYKYCFLISFFFSITFILCIYSYFRIIIDGPGYFPFYWPLKRSKNQNLINDDETSFLIDQETDEYSPSGMLSTIEQVCWVNKRKRPNRSIMAGRRFVIRPDHFCNWTTSYIGKRNYKFFLLFNFWGFVYVLIFTFCCVVESFYEFDVDNFTMKAGFILLFLSACFFFLLMTGYFTAILTYNMCINRTIWEEQNGIERSKFDRGFYENVADVCGSWSKWYTFLLPISPWTELTNEELVKNYQSYY